MVYGTYFDAEFGGDSQSPGLYHVAFLKLFDASVDILSKQIFHTILELKLTRFSLVRETCEAHHLAVEDVYGSSEDFEPIIGIGPSD